MSLRGSHQLGQDPKLAVPGVRVFFAQGKKHIGFPLVANER